MIKLFFLTLLFSMCCFAQSSSKATDANENIRLDSKKPSVFITFERFRKTNEVSNSENSQEILLRLHNNTKWKIFAKSIGADKENNVYGLIYEVKKIPSIEKSLDNEIPTGRRQIHIANIIAIESGKSVLFSINKHHLEDDLAVYVSFSYEWEILGQFGGDLSIIHQAPFWATDLPSQE